MHRSMLETMNIHRDVKISVVTGKIKQFEAIIQIKNFINFKIMEYYNFLIMLDLLHSFIDKNRLN